MKIQKLNESKNLNEELWDSSRITDLVNYYLDRNNYPINTLANLVKDQMVKEGSKLPYNVTDFYDALYMAVDRYNSQPDSDLSKSISEGAFNSGQAEGGFRDTSKRPGGSTSKLTHDTLSGKNTKTVKAKDLKPGMVTNTGKINKVTDLGWVNGKSSVEVSYGGIGSQGSHASDVVAADKEYEVLDESKSIKIGKDSNMREIDIKDNSKAGDPSHPIQKGLKGSKLKHESKQIEEGYSWIKQGDRFHIQGKNGIERYLVVTTYDKETEKHLDKRDRYIQVAREDNDGNFTDYQDLEYSYLAGLKNKGKLIFESKSVKTFGAKAKKLTETFFDDDYTMPIGASTLTKSACDKRLDWIKKDIKTLINCETYEDVLNSEFEVYDCANIIKRSMDKGLSESDAIEKMLDHLVQVRSNWKNDVHKMADSAAEAGELYDIVKSELANTYDIVSDNKGEGLIEVAAIDDDSKSMIEFVVKVKNIANADTDGQALGGSWTVYDLKTKSGLRLKAGYGSNGTYKVQFPRTVFESKSISEATEKSTPDQYEFYDNYLLVKNAWGDGWDICSYDGRPDNITKVYIEDEGFATLQAAKDEIDKWYDEAKLYESNPAELIDCPECGDISFDSKKGRCTKCFYRESLNESVEDFASITSIADECGENTYKASSRDIRFRFVNEDDETKFINKLYELNVPYTQAAHGVIISKSSALDESSTNNLRDSNGKIFADRWYASQYPDDEVGIEQLKYIYLDDALKDRSILDHCDTQVRDRVYKQLDKYIPLSKDSPMYRESKGTQHHKKLDESQWADTPWKWLDVYDQFNKIADEINTKYGFSYDMPREERAKIGREINSAVDNLYAEHKGDPEWDRAYREWHEWDKEYDEAGDPVTEAYFGGYDYEYEVHWVSPDGNDKLLGGSNSLDDASEIAIKQLDEILNSPFETPERKAHFIDSLYIIKAGTEQDVTTAKVGEHQEKLIAELDNKKLSEASYGGAFDIENDQYFTRDDIENAAEEVMGHISETFNEPYHLGGTWFENGQWIVNVQGENFDEYEFSIPVDMRKIRTPQHLKHVYALKMAAELINQIKEYNGMNEAVVSSAYEFDDDVDDLTYYYDDEELKDALTDIWEEVASKQVTDSDGFMTDYTMYRNINTGEYVFVFGDKDIYRPEDGYFDWECETKEQAEEWFASYNGFEEEDVDWELDESLNESLEDDLKNRYTISNAHTNKSVLSNIEKLAGSELVKDLKPVVKYDVQVFEMLSTDNRLFYLVPTTMSQFDVYDANGALISRGEFTRYIVDEILMPKDNMEFVYELVGGEYAGTYSEVESLPCFSGRYTADQSDIRAKGGFTSRKELDNKPILNGYVGPMMNGWKDHKMVLRYETQEVYDALSR